MPLNNGNNLMEEVQFGTNYQDASSPDLRENQETFEERLGRRSPGILGTISRSLGRILQSSPTIVPLSPHTRQVANISLGRCLTSHLSVVSLPTSIDGEMIKIVTVELYKSYEICLVLDSKLPCWVRLFGSNENSISSSKIEEPGFNTLAKLKLNFNTFPNQTVNYFVKVEAIPSGFSELIVYFSLLPMKDGSLEFKLCKQVVTVGKRRFELFEIYGQSRSYNKGESVPVMCQKSNSSATFISPQEGTYESPSERNDCVICLCELRDTMFLPCRHLCICSGCSEPMLNGEDKCPLCRREFQSIISVMPNNEDIAKRSDPEQLDSV